MRPKVYRVAPGVFPRLRSPADLQRMMLDQLEEREKFEAYIEYALNIRSLREKDCNKKIVAIINFSKANKLVVHSFVCGNGSGKIVTGNNRNIASQLRIWGEYAAPDKGSRQLKIVKNDLVDHTVFTENHYQREEIIIELPSLEKLNWMYQVLPTELLYSLLHHSHRTFPRKPVS